VTDRSLTYLAFLVENEESLQETDVNLLVLAELVIPTEIMDKKEELWA